jgi:uncharacterized protein YxeA
LIKKIIQKQPKLSQLSEKSLFVNQSMYPKLETQAEKSALLIKDKNSVHQSATNNLKYPDVEDNSRCRIITRTAVLFICVIICGASIIAGSYLENEFLQKCLQTNGYISNTTVTYFGTQNNDSQMDIIYNYTIDQIGYTRDIKKDFFNLNINREERDRLSAYLEIYHANQTVVILYWKDDPQLGVIYNDVGVPPRYCPGEGAFYNPFGVCLLLLGVIGMIIIMILCIACVVDERKMLKYRLSYHQI